MAESVQEVAGQAQEKAGQAADQAKSKMREQVDQRSTQAGERVASQASDVRSVADELRKQGKDGPAKVAEQAANRAEKVGSWLTESDGDRILRDVEDFGRRNPWAIAAGGLALGFVASRVLKASSSQRYRSSIGSGYSSAGYGSGAGGELPAGVGTRGSTGTGAEVGAAPPVRTGTPSGTGGL